MARGTAELDRGPVAEYAALHGLSRSGARLAVWPYVKAVWGRRHFVLAHSQARTKVGYSSTSLGWMWEVLTPTLNAAVYFLIFGVLLGKGVKPDISESTYLGYLVIGVFLFNFTSRSLTNGAKAIYNNLGMIRALHFPRMVLPISEVIAELRQVWWSIAVMLVMLLAFRNPVGWTWLLLVVVVFLQTCFNMGLSMILARLGAKTSDISQLLPFVTRTWMYMSGVMFSLDATLRSTKLPPWVKDVLIYNPPTIFLDLARGVLIGDPYAHEQAAAWMARSAHIWVAGGLWGAGMLLVGFFFFWSGEEAYGRG